MRIGKSCHDPWAEMKEGLWTRRYRYSLLPLFLFFLVFLSGCTKNPEPADTRKTIVVTYSALASVVKELAGDIFSVKSLIPNGLDPHEWSPSAKDIETMMKSRLIIRNGLGLEGGMEKAITIAGNNGVKIFTVSDHITVRKVESGEGIPSGDRDQAPGADDPHLWMDPVTVKAAILALADYIKVELDIDLSVKARDLAIKLDRLDESIRKEIDTIPPDNRKLVTGHESLGYFARRYGLRIIGAIVPSLTTQAEESASDMAVIKKLITANDVKVIFTELGTPPKVVQALARDAGVKAVSITTHSLPPDLSYFTFMTNIAHVIAESLR